VLAKASSFEITPVAAWPSATTIAPVSVAASTIFVAPSSRA
jgi:hypothetical protein